MVASLPPPARRPARRATAQARHLGPHADRDTRRPRGIAARLIRRRLALVVSQAEAAEAVGVHPVSWARWECGMAEPRGLYRLALERWLRGQEV